MEQGRRPRRGQQAHRHALQGVPPARRARRRARRASRPIAHPRRADGRARPEPDPRGARPRARARPRATPSCCRRTSSARSRRCCDARPRHPPGASSSPRGATEDIRAHAPRAGRRARDRAREPEAANGALQAVDGVGHGRDRRPRPEPGEADVASAAAASGRRSSPTRSGARATEQLRRRARRGAAAACARCAPADGSLEDVFARLTPTAPTTARPEARRTRMRAFWPIYKRELFAFFVTPLAWVLIVGLPRRPGDALLPARRPLRDARRDRRATRRRCRRSSATPCSSTWSSSCSSRR